MNSVTNVRLKAKRRRRPILIQLFIVLILLALVWVSFGQNVLAPQTSSGIPKQLGDLLFVSIVEGSEALAQIRELHGTDIKLQSAYIAKYAHSSPYHKAQATVWVGEAESPDAAAELTRRMREAITKGGSPFSNLRPVTVDSYEVFRIDGPGGAHFFYNSEKARERVVWLTVETSDALPVLEETLKNF
ncbi:MAG: hypothetical protein HY663_01190 [Chloroflexi bacterium]|nr:hypothetical protein [Chloroflexota bacterium]